MASLPPLITAFFGYSNQLTESQLQDDVLIPLIEQWGRVPDQILLQNDGATSQWIDEWATLMRIPVRIFQADWLQHGRQAQMLRESGMRKEANCAVVFLSNRSNRLEKYAETMARRDANKQVFTVTCTMTTDRTTTAVTMTELCVASPTAPASVHGRKSSKGTGRT